VSATTITLSNFTDNGGINTDFSTEDPRHPLINLSKGRTESILAPKPNEAVKARLMMASITVFAGEVAISANGKCSLREAIINANNDAATHADCAAGSGADIIELPAGTYTVNQGAANEEFSVTGDLDIRSNITINGAGKLTTIIQADITSGTAIDRVLHIVSGTAVLNDLIIQNGKAPKGSDGSTCFGDPCYSSDGGPGQNGGGILNIGTLTLNNVIVTNNQAGDGGKAGNVSCSSGFCSTSGGKGGLGGGIGGTGTLTVNSSAFTNNQGGNGGAAGTVNCTGGAICSSSIGQKGNGGAIGGGTVTITEGTFSGNLAYDGGAIQQGNTISITNSNFTANTSTWTGGAVNCNSGSLTCDISNSTFSGNNVTPGGFGGGAIALFHPGVKSITNSTITGNSHNSNGGGVYAFNTTVNINFTTIASNSVTTGNGGGLSQNTGATVNLKNSIIADNIDIGGQAPDISGTITSGGYNHIENTTGGTFTPTTGDVTGSDPGLTSLADNGGLSQTQAPSATSVVLDAIPIGTNGCKTGSGAITVDQRSASRATDSDGNGTSACDKGATELGTIQCGIQAAGEPLAYNFFSGANLVNVNVTDDGSNFECLRITDINIDHPNATANIQTGKYWIIKALQIDKTTLATADYMVDLTLPFATANAEDENCRYTGSWDCGANSYVANTSITRTGITQLSDWAVEDNTCSEIIYNQTDNVYYCTLEEAMADSDTQDGDVIEIPTGTYNDPCIVINKSVTIRPIGGLVTINCLEMDGAGKTMLLDGNLAINQLILTDGLISTNGNNLKCGTTTGGSAASYVVTD